MLCRSYVLIPASTEAGARAKESHGVTVLLSLKFYHSIDQPSGRSLRCGETVIQNRSSIRKGQTQSKGICKITLLALQRNTETDLVQIFDVFLYRGIRFGHK